MDHFLYRNGALHAEDVSIADIAATVGTPFYCYSTATLTRHYHLFTEALSPLPHLVCFAIKSLSNLAVLKTLGDLGAGMDVVSGGEYLRAKAAGVPGDRIVFSGVGKTREEMRLALDTFEVEGIGHNLPFVAAVMDHPRFVSGDITTAFIAEEYPDGFQGATLDEDTLRHAAAAAAAMNRVAEIRRTRITGTMDNHERKVGDDWVVSLQGQSYPVTIAADREGSTVCFADGEALRVASDWTPGEPLARISVNGAPLVMKVGKIPSGFRLRLRGADLKVHVRTPRQAELALLMPEKLPPDTSRFLLCPMPGLIVKINVAEGDEVQEGQALATVEAMKMENILKAERKGVVKKIAAAPGASLRVDEVIMEFE